MAKKIRGAINNNAWTIPIVERTIMMATKLSPIPSSPKLAIASPAASATGVCVFDSASTPRTLTME